MTSWRARVFEERGNCGKAPKMRERTAAQVKGHMTAMDDALSLGAKLSAACAAFLRRRLPIGAHVIHGLDARSRCRH